MDGGDQGKRVRSPGCEVFRGGAGVRVKAGGSVVAGVCAQECEACRIVPHLCLGGAKSSPTERGYFWWWRASCGLRDVDSTFRGLQLQSNEGKLAKERGEDGRERAALRLQHDVVYIQPVLPASALTEDAARVNPGQGLANDEAEEWVCLDAALDKAAANGEASPHGFRGLGVDHRGTPGPHGRQRGC